MTTKSRREDRRGIVIAIDGPAGAGKSTVAKRLAIELGYRLLDTGAIYRAVALVARERGVDWSDEARLADIAAGLDIRFDMLGDRNHVSLGDEDVTDAIRAPEISQGASQVSAHPAVRAALLGLQRRLGAQGGVIAEGRDIGTVVFPEAEAKFFLTASPEVRASRRHAELVSGGSEAAYEDTVRDMRERDARDTGRAVAPLVQAEDAVAVDSSGLDVDEVVARIAAMVRARERS